MKKIVSLLVALLLVALNAMALAELPIWPEFDPLTVEPYKIYTVVEYTIEAIQADLVCTVSANEEKTEFWMECNFYGDDQAIHAVMNDGADLENDLENAFTIDYDKTGFMKTDTPFILKAALDQNIWVEIDSTVPINTPRPTQTPSPIKTPNPSDPYTPGNTFNVGIYEGITYSEFLQWAEFDPHPDYDVCTLIGYTINAIQADLVCTVSANEEKTEFWMECNFYGDDQAIHAVMNDGADLENDLENAFTIDYDKTGFMKLDTPFILKAALDQNIWVEIDSTVPINTPYPTRTPSPTKTPNPSAPYTSGNTFDVGMYEGITYSEFLQMADYAPHPDYDECTMIGYTINAIQADLYCTISANEEKTEFWLECNFYGDDQAIHALLNEGADLENDLENAFTMDYDKTGFMKVDAPAILKAAIDQNIWVPIKKYENTFDLPEELTRIEAYAFTDTAAKTVRMHNNVAFIDDSAFAGSSITTIVGGNEYVKQYALSHGFLYQEQ